MGTKNSIMAGILTWVVQMLGKQAHNNRNLFNSINIIIVHSNFLVILDVFVTDSEDAMFVKYSHASWIANLVCDALLNTYMCSAQVWNSVWRRIAPARRQLPASLRT